MAMNTFAKRAAARDVGVAAICGATVIGGTLNAPVRAQIAGSYIYAGSAPAGNDTGGDLLILLVGSLCMMVFGGNK
jgi:hypothetical protein